MKYVLLLGWVTLLIAAYKGTEIVLKKTGRL